MRMDNPWRELPGAPDFVLPSDAALVDGFNQRARDRTRIRLELLPEPFLGNLDAPIVLLNLNPGFSEYDHLFHNSALGRELITRNLVHESLEFPFYLLDPRAETAPGSGWWRQRLRQFVDAVGRIEAAHRILCIEYLPYHSARYDSQLDRVALPSQEYSRLLVRQAMERDAYFVHMRKKNSRWFEWIPELETYPHSATVKNHQRPFISRGNLPEHFDELVAIAKAF